MATTSAPAPREAAVQVVVRLRPLAGEPSENFTVNAAEKVGITSEAGSCMLYNLLI